MSKAQRQCDWCGKTIFRYPSQFSGKQRVFCCRKCLDAYSTKELNPSGYGYKDFSKRTRRFSRKRRWSEWSISRITIRHIV